MSSLERRSCSLTRRPQRTPSCDPKNMQATCMQTRGELNSTKLRFDASLPSATVADDKPLASLGMELAKRPHSRGGRAVLDTKLKISKIASKRLGVATPVGVWNAKQDRLRQTHFALRPGDRLCTVNGCRESFGAVIAELHSGREAHVIRVERDLTDVLQPKGQAPLLIEPPSAPRDACSFLRSRVHVLTAASRLAAMTAWDKDVEKGSDFGRRPSAVSTECPSEGTSGWASPVPRSPTPAPAQGKGAPFRACPSPAGKSVAAETELHLPSLSSRASTKSSVASS
eukprot:TRINITY_DN58384_c0_g1_i1.p1 TRINITY_DN58384_c0_g1~~TRINITY_DN58384_c0_g1_i1.p1  ORF type:complete len:302 (-),score=40.86 TRINITY_DN58384_c0_g1_i1:52-906(-)